MAELLGADAAPGSDRQPPRLQRLEGLTHEDSMEDSESDSDGWTLQSEDSDE